MVNTELSFLWLEITGECQLMCTHCYADSGPRGTRGTMTDNDWRRVIDEAETLGVRMVQFIGGEPTLYPSFPDLVRYALGRRLLVEVFSNLVQVPDDQWEVFSLPGVRLATSYYTDHAGQHEVITRRRGSYPKTKANILEALRRSIPLRAGVIDVHDGQRVAEAIAELKAIGVTDVDVDRLRHVGRGARDQQPDISQLCGACARGKVAIASNGDVWPCVFSRWMPVGNILSTTLENILASAEMKAVVTQLNSTPSSRAWKSVIQRRVIASRTVRPDTTLTPRSAGPTITRTTSDFGK